MSGSNWQHCGNCFGQTEIHFYRNVTNSSYNIKQLHSNAFYIIKDHFDESMWILAVSQMELQLLQFSLVCKS